MKNLISSLALGFVLTGTLVAAETTNQNAAVAAAQIQKAAPKTSTPAGWTDDMEAAKKQAAAEGKLILADFSGSDWCSWCVTLDKEVFSQKEFLDAAKEKFVLVFVDSPRDATRLSDLAKKQNGALIKKYKIRGFPTVMVMDASGEPIAETGYQRGGPANYLKHLDELVEAQRVLAELKSAIRDLEVGSEARVQKIHAVVKNFSFDEQAKQRKFVEEVLAFDADGAAGMRDSYPLFTIFMPLSEKVRAVSARIYEDGRAIYEKTTPEQRKDPGLGRKIFIEAAKNHVDALRQCIEAIDAAREKAPQGEIQDLLRSLKREVTAQYNAVAPKPKEVPPQSENESDPPKALFDK